MRRDLNILLADTQQKKFSQVVHPTYNHVAEFDVIEFRGVAHMEGKDDGTLITTHLRLQSRGRHAMDYGPNLVMPI